MILNVKLFTFILVVTLIVIFRRTIKLRIELIGKNKMLLRFFEETGILSRIGYIPKFIPIVANRKALDASYSSRFRTIVFNYEWATHIVKMYNSGHSLDKTKNAFLHSYGHELTHAEDNDIEVNGYGKKERKFLNWVNEVHADFGACEKMGHRRRSLLCDAIEYKIKYRRSFNNPKRNGATEEDTWDVGGEEHPPWYKRLEYAKYYNFDVFLIKRIADDLGNVNEDLCKLVRDHFAPIVLFPSPESNV